MLQQISKREAKAAVKPTGSGSTSERSPATPQRANVMAALWQRMTDLFPFRWTSAVGEWATDSTAVTAWAEALAGLTDDQLRHGMRSLGMNGAKFPPSGPEFRLMCEGDVPDERAAYSEAVRAACGDWQAHAWNHPAIYAAARDMGPWSLRQLIEREARPMFAKCYARAVARYRAGDDMDAPEPLRLAKPERAPADPITVAGEMAKMAAFFGSATDG